ncbi:kinase-like domain-containing protein [Talaromyces proteolyticus]|uniref:Kinase-like domain-containing protein n=1 Tax=Talaromyces proteolyticus TaxID=1131652 RepID=A0AAD4KGJ1_9EURO|nr:kinase-like domain-containing protein [Talaromyces proteolyticus]KAH8688992.1 kinase-like domain-containing protein [Talaromyces proteolyticus]
MGAEEYLPEPLKTECIQSLLDELSLGRPSAINPLKVTAAFHAIYILTYDAESLPAGVTTSGTPLQSVDLVLRVSGDHVPGIKTSNEAAILDWVSQNTSIPVPSVIRYDATTNNPLNREFIILTRSPGVTLSDIYDSLSQEDLDNICRQLMKFLVEIHQHPFNQIGGLVHSDDQKKIIPGPILDEHFWFTPDIKRYFDTEETFETLNVGGPFNSYTNFTIALMEKYIHVAEIQKDLRFMLEHIPRLRAFCKVLPNFSEQLDETKIRLAHKDLHFANMLYDQSTGRITAILDWEFASAVPFQIWDPVRAFLFNAKDGSEAYEEKYRLRGRFHELCKQSSVAFLDDANFTSDLQEKMHNVSNIMRIIVTLIPRGQFVDRTPEFVKDLLQNLEAFGV